MPAAPINRVDQVLDDPQVRLRDMVVDLAHPKLGTVKMLGTPIRPADAAPFQPAPPPALGEHTDAVLGELLGYPAARIEALRRSGVVG